MADTTKVSNAPNAPKASRLTPVQWAICLVAAIGFAFDTYHILVLPLIVGPALLELGNLRPGTPEFNSWTGLLFYVPAVAGGHSLPPNLRVKDQGEAPVGAGNGQECIRTRFPRSNSRPRRARQRVALSRVECQLGVEP